MSWREAHPSLPRPPHSLAGAGGTPLRLRWLVFVSQSLSRPSETVAPSYTSGASGSSAPTLKRRPLALREVVRCFAAVGRRGTLPRLEALRAGVAPALPGPASLLLFVGPSLSTPWQACASWRRCWDRRTPCFSLPTESSSPTEKVPADSSAWVL